MSIVGEILTVIGTIIKVVLIIYGVLLAIGIIIEIGAYIVIWTLPEPSEPSASKSSSRSLTPTPSQEKALTLNPEKEVHRITRSAKEDIRRRSEQYSQEVYDFIKTHT